MLAINAGPRKGSSLANQPFLLLPERTALALRVVVLVVETLFLDVRPFLVEVGMRDILLEINGDGLVK